MNIVLDWFGEDTNKFYKMIVNFFFLSFFFLFFGYQAFLKGALAVL